jgi:hypothetical protein
MRAFIDRSAGIEAMGGERRWQILYSSMGHERAKPERPQLDANLRRGITTIN